MIVHTLERPNPDLSWESQPPNCTCNISPLRCFRSILNFIISLSLSRLLLLQLISIGSNTTYLVLKPETLGAPLVSPFSSANPVLEFYLDSVCSLSAPHLLCRQRPSHGGHCPLLWPPCFFSSSHHEASRDVFFFKRTSNVISLLKALRGFPTSPRVKLNAVTKPRLFPCTWPASAPLAPFLRCQGVPCLRPLPGRSARHSARASSAFGGGFQPSGNLPLAQACCLLSPSQMILFCLLSAHPAPRPTLSVFAHVLFP